MARWEAWPERDAGISPCSVVVPGTAVSGRNGHMVVRTWLLSTTTLGSWAQEGLSSCASFSSYRKVQTIRREDLLHCNVSKQKSFKPLFFLLSFLPSPLLWPRGLCYSAAIIPTRAR